MCKTGELISSLQTIQIPVQKSWICRRFLFIKSLVDIDSHIDSQLLGYVAFLVVCCVSLFLKLTLEVVVEESVLKIGGFSLLSSSLPCILASTLSCSLLAMLTSGAYIY